MKQRKRNRIPLGDVSCVIDVQMIPAVVIGQQLCGVARVVHRFVEIDTPSNSPLLRIQALTS